ISLHIENGEFMVLVGPSGCGKSTTLRMIAGLEKITSGTISIGDHVVNGLEPKDRGIAMVFQNYALYPHMTLFNHMSGLKQRGPVGDLRMELFFSTLRDRISNQGESVWPTTRLTESKDLAEKKGIPWQEWRTNQSSVIFLMAPNTYPVPRSRTYTDEELAM